MFEGKKVLESLYLSKEACMYMFIVVVVKFIDD